MESFLAFLKSAKSFLKTIASEPKNVHITLGNESCDLDSSISSLILGYFLSKQNSEIIVVPVLNVSQENFLLRTENCFVLKEAGIPLENLVFSDQINVQDLISKHIVTASLVDHHILSKNDEKLSTYVRQIFDHRPVDSSYQWDQSKVQIRIEPVGSCCTLIADEIIKKDNGILTKSLAYLLYETIIYDTIALKPDNSKAKPLDIQIGTHLEKKYNFSEDRQVLFNRLWAAHNEVSHLTVKQLLYKDLKVVGEVYIPGLPMLVEDYFKKEGAYEAVVGFACEHRVTCVLLVGLDASSSTVRRDIAIYSKTIDDNLRVALLNTFKTNEEYDFQFEKRCSFGETVELLHVHNIKLSRKQFVPLVKQAWNSINIVKKK